MEGNKTFFNVLKLLYYIFFCNLFMYVGADKVFWYIFQFYCVCRYIAMLESFDHSIIDEDQLIYLLADQSISSFLL